MILEILLFLLGIFIIGGFSIFYWKSNKSGGVIKVQPNLPIIENDCRSHFTNGYTMGLLTSVIPRKNGCSLVEFFPLDINQGKEQINPEIQSVIVKNECIKPFARGELSPRRERIKLIGRSNKDIPEKMRTTEEGKWENEQSQKAHLEQVFGKVIPAGDQAIASLMADWSRGAGKIAENIIEQKKEESRKLNFQQRETKNE